MNFRELKNDEVSIFIRLQLNENVTELFELLKKQTWVLKAIEKRFQA